MLSQLFPTRQATFDAQLNTHLGTIANGASKNAGITPGDQCGIDVVASRANDNSGMSPTYSGETAIGQWRGTGPGFQNAAMPHWRYVKPWSANTATQFMAGPTPAVGTAGYAAAYNEVKIMGVSGASSGRTQY